MNTVVRRVPPEVAAHVDDLRQNLRQLREALDAAQVRIAQLQVRDRQWEEAFAKLAGLALEDDGTCPVGDPILAEEFIAHCRQVDGRCACARSWAGAPEPLESTETPQEEE